VLLTVAAVLSPGVAVAGAAPLAGSAAASPVSLSVTASTSTYVGLQVFAMAQAWGGSNPSGSVTFSMFGPADPTCTSAPLFVSTVALSGGPTATSNHFTTSAVGTYRWEASYGGDALNAPSGPTSCAAPLAAVVAQPYFSAVSATAGAGSGGTIQASASLFGYNPTGTVTFYLSAPGDVFCSTTMFTSMVAVHGSGSYLSAPYVYPAGGLYKWRVAYSGDTNNMADPVSACLNAASQVTVAAPAPSGWLYPQAGQANVSASVPFTWQAAVGAQAYFVMVGTTTGGWDVAWSGTLPATQTSYTLPAVPGGTLHALLYTEIAGAWTTQQETFTAAASEAWMAAPESGATTVNPAAPLTWNPVAGAQAYILWVSTTYGEANLVNTGYVPATVTSYTPTPALPAGQTLYVILFTQRNNTLTGQLITITTAGGTPHAIPSIGSGPNRGAFSPLMSSSPRVTSG